MSKPLTAETFINWMWAYEYHFNNKADHSVFRNRFSRQIARLNEDASRADSLAVDLAAAVVRADKAEGERDEARAELAKADAQIEELNKEAQTYSDALTEEIARAEKAERERDEAREAWKGALESVKEAIAVINSLRAEHPHPLTPRQNLAALWESAHRPVGGRIPAGTAIITRSDHGNGDVRYQTLEATGRDLPDPGYTLERNYNYGPENGEEYRLLDPPARPEGAEDIEGLITYHYDDMPAETLTALSDALAERYTPIEGGAR